MLKFLQRLHFNPGSEAYGSSPAIVQYHPQAMSEGARRVGHVVAYVEAAYAEHGPSLAAGPAALDILDRLVLAFARGDVSLREGAHGLIGEARELLKRATPPEGSIHPNGTPRLR